MNLATIIEGHDDERRALVAGAEPVTYGDLRADVAAFAAALRARGVEPGDRVAIVAGTSPLFAAGMLGALAAGGVAVPLNPASPPAELQRELEVVGARVAVVGRSGLAGFAGVDRAAAGLERVLAPAGLGLDGADVLEDALDEADPLAAPVERGDDDLALLVFTSGTVGAPRAACLTHGNLRANLDQVQAHPGRALRGDDVVLGVLPLFHIFGLNVVLDLSLYVGASVVLADRFDPVATAALVREHGVTVVAGAPPMWAAWLAADGVDPSSFRSVRLAASGAARLPPEVAEGFRERFGVTISEGYGLTEAAPIVAAAAGDEPRPGSIGRPVEGVEIRLVDDEGEDALAGDPGEVWVRGPNVFAGYWQDPEATAAALTADGWLRTGDVAVADDDGWLYLVDRTKDVVIVSGFNVFPGEVEEALREQPGVAEAAVVGVPHAQTGEAVEAWVVPGPGVTLEPDAVRDGVAARLARYKCPAAVHVVDELPTGLAGKVLRRRLRTPSP